MVPGHNDSAGAHCSEKHTECLSARSAGRTGLLEGASLAQRVSEGARMFYVDYMTGFEDYIELVNSQKPATTRPRRNVALQGPLPACGVLPAVPEVCTCCAMHCDLHALRVCDSRQL